MLKEQADLEQVGVIDGDAPRQKSLEKINQRYCVEILLIWF